MTEQTQIEAHLLAETTSIVSAYVGNNAVPRSEMPALIADVYRALAGLSAASPVVAEPVVEIAKPSASEVKKSITPNGIISFIDGKPYKTLKRHLGTHGLDPHAYRRQYGLPNDYPMVAPSYAAQRSALAKSIGLGQPGGMRRAS